MVSMDELQKRFKVAFSEIDKVMVGQQDVMEQAMAALLCNGHVFVEGYPGLAKTTFVKTLSNIMDLTFSRIQGTPDLLPSDITGTYVIDDSKGKRELKFQPGPIFANVVLVDEVNRATPKCLSGDTSVALGDGRILTMENIFKQYNGKAHIPVGRDEEFIVPKENFLVPSFNPKNCKIELKPVKYLYKQKTDAPLYEVELKSGRKIKTSPVHPFFSFNDTKISTVKADSLKIGMNVLVPRYLPYSKGSNKIRYSKENFEESDKVKVEIERRRKLFNKVVKLKSKYTLTQIIKFLNVDNYDKNLIISLFRRKPTYLNFKIQKDSFFINAKQFGQVKHLKFPRVVTIELAHFFGLLISEGYHNGRELSIDMKDHKLIDYFQKLLLKLFSYNKNIYQSKNGKKIIVINSKTLNKILTVMGYNIEALSGTKIIPEFILKANNNVIKEFLRMYYEGDGCVKDESINVTSKSLDVINKISYMLLRFGIVSRIKKESRKVNGNLEHYYVLAIYGSFVNEFANKIGFFGKTKSDNLIKLTNRITNKFNDGLPGMHSLLRKIRKEFHITHSNFYNITGMHAHNLENPKNRAKHSRAILIDIFSKLNAKGYDLEKYDLSFLYGDFYVDFVQNIDIIQPKEDYYLYDFTIENNHSFVAGTGGIIAHNTHSAILEAMQEKQVTVGSSTYKLEEPFFVLATGNPIEQEGVFKLSEAQIDRFLFKINIGYPKLDDELKIVDRFTELTFEDIKVRKIFNAAEIINLQKLVRQVPIANDIKKYAVELVTSTRNKKDLIEYGASPRASISLIMAGKARALMNGRKYVSKEDIQTMAYPVLRHRIILSFEAERQNMSEDDVIKSLLKK